MIPFVGEPTEQCLTDSYKINVDSNCSRFDFPIRWFNNLGGWETFVFRGLKDYALDIERKEYTNDIFTDWDDNYINGDTIDDYYEVNAKELLTARSLKTNKTTVDWLKSVCYSIKVYQIRNSKLRTIKIDGKKFKLYKDRDKLYELEIDIIPTDSLPIQTQ